MCLFIAIFQMFTVCQLSREGVNNMFSFINKYFKCSLFRIYSLVRVDNMCTFKQQYFKCLLFLIYPLVGENNMCTFISIFQMFNISYAGVNNMYTFIQQYSNLRCFAYISVSG